MTTILKRSTAHPRLFIAHIHAGIHDKNLQTRHFSTSHLQTFLDAQAPRTRQTIEHTSGSLDQLVECVTKSLLDVNPVVREIARPAYWSFHTIWPAKAADIVEKLDATQKKQLDKVRPSDASPIPIARPPIGAAKKSSGIGALLAEKRKAAMAARQEIQRTVSSPVPVSPSLGQGRPTPRSTSSHLATVNTEPVSNDSSPTAKTSIPLMTPSRPSTSAPQLLNSAGGSPAGKPSPAESPLRDRGSIPANGSGIQSPTPSTSSQATRSTSSARRTLPSQTNGRSTLSPGPTLKAISPERAALEAQAAQAARGLMAAQQLLEVDDDDGPANPVTPVKPPRPIMQNTLLQTPMNGIGRNVWEDSPGPSAVTPMMVDKLKGRRHERSWWNKRQQCEYGLVLEGSRY